MSINQSSNANILWFLPTHGDGRYLGTSSGGREVNFNYLRQIAQAADQLGYFGVLLPTGRSCAGTACWWPTDRCASSRIRPFEACRSCHAISTRPGA